MTKTAVCGPFAERDLADQIGPDPMRVAFRRCGYRMQRAGLARAGPELFLKVGDIPAVESGANRTYVPDAVVIGHAQQKRGDVAFARTPAGDNHFLVSFMLDLDPRAGAFPGLIFTRQSLGHDAFEPTRFAGVQGVAQAAFERFGNQDRIACRTVDGLEEFLASVGVRL